MDMSLADNLLLVTALVVLITMIMGPSRRQPSRTSRYGIFYSGDGGSDGDCGDGGGGDWGGDCGGGD
jgi:hypothetical protein